MNNVSLSQRGSSAVLTSALLVYTQQGQIGSNSEISLLTEHKVTMIDNQPVIQSGKILSQRSMRDMARKILNKRANALRLIPENMLAQADKTFVWWIPSQVQTVYFRANEPGLENRCGQVEIPSCIFAVTEKDSYVLCYEGAGRPTANTPLHFSPFFNVWDGHNICMGSTKRTKEGDVDAWTKAFFSSAFSHTNYRSTAAKLLRKGERQQLWRDLLDHQMEKFPFECLPPANLTLEQFIAKISK